MGFDLYSINRAFAWIQRKRFFSGVGGNSNSSSSQDEDWPSASDGTDNSDDGSREEQRLYGGGWSVVSRDSTAVALPGGASICS